MTEEEMVRWHYNSMDIGWVDSVSWKWTGRPGVVQYMVLQRIRHD